MFYAALVLTIVIGLVLGAVLDGNDGQELWK